VATHRTRDLDQEPTPADLAAIEREWPLIEAELALTDIEVRLWCALGKATELDRHRLRRAEQRVIREALTYLAAQRRTAAGRRRLSATAVEGWAA
jgi:hypothetical protein